MNNCIYALQCQLQVLLLYIETTVHFHCMVHIRNKLLYTCESYNGKDNVSQDNIHILYRIA